MATNVIDGLKANLPGGRRGQVLAESPDAERTRVRWTRLVVGVLVMVASMVGVWLLVQAQSDPTEVWVARDRIEAGTVVTGEHVALQRVEADSQLFALGGDVLVVDRVVRVTIPRGSTLVDGHFFSSTDEIGSAGGSLSQVAVVFSSGRVPSVVQENDLLRLQVIGDETEELFDQVPVKRVERSESGSAIVVTLEVGVEEGGRLLSALADGQAWAAIVGRR